MRHRAMAATPVTFGHRRILPPGPGHRANRRAGRGSGPDQPQLHLLGNLRDLENRGGHPGHDQGRRLSIPQVVAPLLLEMRVPRTCGVGKPRIRITERPPRSCGQSDMIVHGPPTSNVDGVILWRRRELSSTCGLASAMCRFCRRKRPVDKKLFFGPNVRFLSRWCWSETPWPLSRYGVRHRSARPAYDARV
jgi:hypothetical protein